MSDDEADPELLELLRESLGWNRKKNDEISSDTGVLKDAEYISNNSIDVSIDMLGSRSAAASIHASMSERAYSTATWSQHELHPKISDDFSDIDLANFIFTMDLLNFSFWSTLPQTQRFQIEYRGKCWTGYNSLVALLRRALEEKIPITTPSFWIHEATTDETLQHVFRSATNEEIPLLQERIDVLREAGHVLSNLFPPPHLETPTVAVDTSTNDNVVVSDIEIAEPVIHPLTDEADVQGITQNLSDTTLIPPTIAEPGDTHDAQQENISQPSEGNAIPPQPDMSIVQLIGKADRSAGKLVNLLSKHFPAFRDETKFDGKKVKLMKRAQIFVADLWAAFDGKSYGEFTDIDHLTMFADYRVPQILHTLGVLSYSPPLHYHISDQKPITSGHSWEVQLRGCSIWAIELIRRELVKTHPETTVNAVLLDFFLYDLAKEKEALDGTEGLLMSHHRTRSIWY